MHPYSGKNLRPLTHLLPAQGNMMGFARRGVYFDDVSAISTTQSSLAEDKKINN